jgi:hypothetical protein
MPFRNFGKEGLIKDLVQNDMDWPYILQVGERQGLIPLIYRSLEAVHSEGVPEGVMTTLRDQFRAITISNLTLTAQLFKVLDLFQANGIPVIPYKGPTLALLTHGDVCLRQFCDLDFLIHKHNFIRAKELLESEDYEPEYHLSPREEAIYLKNECEYNFYSFNKKVLVELHWDVVQKYFSCSLDLEEFRKHLKPVSLLGREVMTFSPEGLLLILCVHHGGKHHWEILGWISDVAHLINAHEDMNWEWVAETASRSGISRMLFLGLYLARELLSADLPDSITKMINDETIVKSLAERICAKIFDGVENPVAEFDRFVLYLKQRERLRDKTRYCLRRFFTCTEKDWSLLRLPPTLSSLYNLIRPIRLTGKYGSKLLRNS